MATLVVEEFSYPGTYKSGQVILIAKQPSLTVQTISYSTETKSSPFSLDTKCVRIQSDSQFHYSFGVNPTATTNDPWVPADNWEYFLVRAGHVISVVVSA